jgi:hypothetical protein
MARRGAVVAAHQPADVVEHYLRLRAELVRPDATQLAVPLGTPPQFWNGYADLLRGPDTITVTVDDTTALDVPAPTGRVGLWRSAGIGSAYTEQAIGHLDPELLDYRETIAGTDVETWRGSSPLHFVLAALTLRRGLSVAYLGLMRTASCGAPNRAGGDDPLAFVRLWNSTHTAHRLRTVCGELTRDQVLLALGPDLARCTSSCRVHERERCGRCAGCLATFLTARAVGIDLGVRASPAAVRELALRYRRYLRSEFASEPDNHLQYVVHLQMTYGLRLNDLDDCDSPPQEKISP